MDMLIFAVTIFFQLVEESDRQLIQYYNIQLIIILYTVFLKKRQTSTWVGICHQHFAKIYINDLALLPQKTSDIAFPPRNTLQKHITGYFHENRAFRSLLHTTHNHDQHYHEYINKTIQIVNKSTLFMQDMFCL